ncbi:MAG: hypothetical protein LAO20_06735 [Acidobacteriia bacterium]|nr:hypothetical protein [Terriglobia bacterium]
MSWWFGVAWIFMGLMWLWRAYAGHYPGGTVTLTTDSTRIMSKRERVIGLFLGIANLLLGMANLWLGLRHSR